MTVRKTRKIKIMQTVLKLKIKTENEDEKGI